MKRDLALWQFGGFVCTVLGDTLLHFVYGWTGNSLLVAPFAAVNESTWEHAKLLYLPMVAFAAVQHRYFGDDSRFWCIKLRGLLLGIALIPLLFYTWNGAFGQAPDWLNITWFFVAAGVAFLVEIRLFRQSAAKHCRRRLAITVILLVGILFAVFSFFPPHLPLFEDPLTATYGVTRI